MRVSGLPRWTTCVRLLVRARCDWLHNVRERCPNLGVSGPRFESCRAVSFRYVVRRVASGAFAWEWNFDAVSPFRGGYGFVVGRVRAMFLREHPPARPGAHETRVAPIE